MFTSFECLPIEIHERILSLLTEDSLISASKVCRLWFTLANRIAKIQYEKVIPQECIDEVKKEACIDDENLWLQVLNHHNQQQHLVNKMLKYKMPLYSAEIDTCNKEVCFALFGSCCFVSEADKIQMFDAESGNAPLTSLNCDGPVKQLHVVPKLNLLIVLSNKLEFFTVPDTAQTTYNMKKLKVSLSGQSHELNGCKGVSVDDSYIAIQMDHSTISAYMMEKKDADQISLASMNSFKAPHQIYTFSIWNCEVLTLLETGEVLRWVITSEVHSQCGMYQEIRYRNPVWVYRGRIFCSTLTSRVLLGLWHLEVGTFYWLMGKPKTNLLRCFNLDPLIGHVIEEVCTLCLRQRLLVCGTNGGKIIIYHLSDLFFSEQELYNKETLNTEFDREPDLIINVCAGPIEDVKVEFAENKIYIVVRTVKVQRTLACIQCIVLSEERKEQVFTKSDGDTETTQPNGLKGYPILTHFNNSTRAKPTETSGIKRTKGSLPFYRYLSAPRRHH